MHRGVHATGRIALTLVFLVLAAVGKTGCDGDGSGPPSPNVPQTAPAPPTPPPPPAPHLTASPCMGTVVLVATPPRSVGTAALVTLEMEFTAGSETVAFDWIGPYAGGRDFRGNLSVERFLLWLTDWTTNVAPGSVRHAMTLAWPAGSLPGLETGIRFRSEDGACSGEPSVVCTETGCELRPSGDEPTGTAFRRR